MCIKRLTKRLRFLPLMLESMQQKWSDLRYNHTTGHVRRAPSTVSTCWLYRVNIEPLKRGGCIIYR